MSLHRIARTLVPFLLLLVACSGSERPTEPQAPSTPGSVVSALRAHPELAPHLQTGGSLEYAGGGYRLAHAVSAAFTDLEVTLPADGHAPLRLSIAGSSGLWLELWPDAPFESPANLIDSSIVFTDAMRDTDIVHVVEPGRAEEIRLLRTPAAPSEARWIVRQGPEIASVRLREGRVEAIDSSGRIRISSEGAFAVDARGERREASVRLLSSTLIVEVDTKGLSYPIALDPAWTSVSSMLAPHVNHTATLLASGKLLVVGGATTNELYDPTTNAWSAAASSTIQRKLHTATLLADGKVLVAGGSASTAGANAAELYDPATNTWSSGGLLAAARESHIAALLPSGKVLVAGGRAGTTPITTAEIYDPTSNTWSPGGTMLVRHAFGIASAVLPSGKVLVAGGADPDPTPLSTAEIFDPATTTWTLTTPMSVGRLGASATTMPDGSVLLAGGAVDNTSEKFVESTGAWTSGAAMLLVHRTHVAALVKGRLLVAGGSTSGGGYTDVAEIFDPNTNKWLAPGTMTSVRTNFTATTIPTDRVLVVGGYRAGGTPTSTVEIFQAIATGSACTSNAECATLNCAANKCCDPTAGPCPPVPPPPKPECTKDIDCPTDKKCDTSVGKCVPIVTNPGSTPPSNSGGCGCNGAGCTTNGEKCEDSGCAKTWKWFNCDCCKTCGFSRGESDAATFGAWILYPLALAVRRRTRRRKK